MASVRMGLRRRVTTVLLAGAAALVVIAQAACEKRTPAEHVLTRSGRPTPGGRDAALPPEPRDASVDGGFTSDVMPVCGPAPAVDLTFDKPALLESIAQCAQRQYCAFEAYAKDFADKAAAHADAPGAATREAAQAAFYFAMQHWQVAELFRFGPAAPTMEPGGQGLRGEIYAFPSVSRCKIDEHIVDEGYAQGVAGLLVTARGLGAAEYLLFYEGEENSCSGFSSINAEGSWEALGAGERSRRKRAYLKHIAAAVYDAARALREAWDPAGGNFERAFTRPGEGDVYADQQAALNAASHALFYVDKELKDEKLAYPAGLTTCPDAVCPDSVESPHALLSGEHVQTNLRAFRLLFQGCGDAYGGLGFDDWLRAANMEPLADDMLNALSGAEQAADGLGRSIKPWLLEDPQHVIAVHAAVKRLTDLLKTQFVSALDLDLPMSSEGDND